MDGNIQTDGNAGALDYTSGGTVFGTQRWLDECTLIGLFGGVSRQFTNTRAPYQSADIESTQFGGYLRQNYDHGHYGLLAGAWGYNDYETARAINFATFNGPATADYSGHQGSLYLERGFENFYGQWCVRPMAALQYIHIHQNAFSETGAGLLNLAVDEHDTNSLRGILGWKISSDHYSRHGWRITPELRTSLMYEMLDTDSVLSAGFAALETPIQFTSQGLTLRNRLWRTLGLHLNVSPCENLTLYANYDLQMHTYQIFHVGSGGVQFVW